VKGTRYFIIIQCEVFPLRETALHTQKTISFHGLFVPKAQQKEWF
jgi:hypothetical protein